MMLDLDQVVLDFDILKISDYHIDNHAILVKKYINFTDKSSAGAVKLYFLVLNITVFDLAKKFHRVSVFMLGWRGKSTF